MNSSMENNNTSPPLSPFDTSMAALRGLAFFSGMPVDILKALAYFCKHMQYPAGQEIFEQNEIDDRAYYILHGQAELIRTDEQGNETIMGTFEEEKFFGALALLADVKRLFTLRARTPLTLIVLPRKKIVQTMLDGQGSAGIFLEAVTRQLVRWEETLLEAPSCGQRSLRDTGVSLI